MAGKQFHINLVIIYLSGKAALTNSLYIGHNTSSAQPWFCSLFS